MRSVASSPTVAYSSRVGWVASPHSSPLKWPLMRAPSSWMLMPLRALISHTSLAMVPTKIFLPPGAMATERMRGRMLPVAAMSNSDTGARSRLQIFTNPSLPPVTTPASDTFSAYTAAVWAFTLVATWRPPNRYRQPLAVPTSALSSRYSTQRNAWILPLRPRMPFLLFMVRPWKLWNLMCLTPTWHTSRPPGANATARVLFLSPLALAFREPFFQSYTAQVWSLSWPTDARNLPSSLKASWHTARLCRPSMTATVSMVVLSHTTILGFFPISPVATSLPSGWSARQMTSSVWRRLKFWCHFCTLRVMPACAAVYTMSPAALYRRLLRASSAR
mmetsp:Transcript_43112/g.88143  ORF Transcript_43112/g.88143 Transcript_43112/m.88143 type:complete len:333 (+) Transcript_43112:166-1164(+)